MDYIALPFCSDTSGSTIFWAFVIFGVIGCGLFDIFTKRDMFDDYSRNIIACVIGAAIPVGILFYEFWSPFTGVAIKNDIIELHYFWPRPPVIIHADSIRSVMVDASLQFYQPNRKWKHRLEIKTDNNQEFDSAYVCMDMKKVKVDYQSAIFTRTGDPIEQAESAITYTAIKSILASPDLKNIDPMSYGRMFYRVMLEARLLANKENATPEDKARALARLNEIKDLVQKHLGENHYAAGIVYKFLGSTYGLMGNLQEAEKMFKQGDDICNNNFNQTWYKLHERADISRLTLYEFQHPEVRPPHSALSFE